MKVYSSLQRSIGAIGAVVLLAACSQNAPVTTQSGGGATGMAGGTVVAAAGTDFYGRLQQPISSKTSKDGATFTLVQTDTFYHKLPALHGSVIEGHLADVHPAGPLRKPAMTLVFDDIRLSDGTKSSVNVQLVSVGAFEPKTHHLRTIGLMIAGAMAGHEVAKHAGGAHGGMLGAAGGYILSQQLKTDISVPAGTVIELRFRSPVTTGS